MKASSHFRKFKKIKEVVLLGNTLPQPVVLVMCGSFNPIHNAHIEAFSAAEKRLKSENIATLGCLVSPVSDGYGKKDLAPFASRKKIIELAIEDHSLLEIDSWEGDQAEYTRTYYVLKHIEEAIREYYKETEPDAFETLSRKGITVDTVFTCGADLFETFFLPKVWSWDLLQQLIDEFRIVVIKRTGSPSSRSELMWGKGSQQRIVDEVDGIPCKLIFSNASIFFCALDTPDDISSTKIRAIVQEEATVSRNDNADVDTCLMSFVPAKAVHAVKECYSKK